MSMQMFKQQVVRFLALALFAATLATAHLAGPNLDSGDRHPSVGTPLTLPALADGPQVGTGGG
ncbi:MAG: hypothetical protein R3A44_00395 [Caldilineaceae bacterium]